MLSRLRVLAGMALVLSALALAACSSSEAGVFTTFGSSDSATSSYVDTLSLDSVSAYDGDPYVEIDGNDPTFSSEKLSQGSFESYAALDALGRCGTAYALVGEETMPTGERGSISEVHPTGWHSTRYSFIDGENLYNRCHLIAYKLTGENANERNLVTGTRYMNATGMLYFEDMVADYIYETGNHVLYRVTPVFAGDELVCRGVHMEAESVEDEGAGVSFNVFCYNVQPGVEIDYATGDNWLAADAAEGEDAAGSEADGEDAAGSAAEHEYVLNTRSMRFHEPSCESVEDIGERNKESYTGTRESLINRGYEPCSRCNP